MQDNFATPSITARAQLVRGEQVRRRVAAIVTAVGCGSILVVAAFLTPNTEGHGTHTQLNLPPCGWVLAFDMPCPTCGMTTSFAFAAEGDFVSSFLAQPFGLLLALATVVTLLLSLAVATTGTAIWPLLGRLWHRRVGWGLGFLLLASWVYKIVEFKELWS